MTMFHLLWLAGAHPLTTQADPASIAWTSWPMIASVVGVVICAVALAMTLWNLRQYTTPKSSTIADTRSVSVCIPARNEQTNLEACVRGLLAQSHANLHILVYDDQSTDDTPNILARLSALDARVRAVPTQPLPPGWNGKQHACWRMAQASTSDVLVFTDADVRFAPHCIATALAALARTPDTGLVSTFPRQETRTLPEKLIVPMIFFILFSYLPFVRMKRTKDPSASAGCGQFLCVTREAYYASGTHEAFKASMHDGIKLPRLVRKAGFKTDLFDATNALTCRMYFGWSSTWRGFTKNAFEGLGSLGLLMFLTIMHLAGHVVPWALLVLGMLRAWQGDLTVAPWTGLAALACLLQLTQRITLASRLQTSLLGALLHPLGVLLMTAIQWHSWILHLRGQRTWRGRTTQGDAAVAVS